MNHQDKKSLLFKECFKSIIYVSVVILFFQGISNSIVAIIGQFTYQSGQGWVGPFSNALVFLGSGCAAHYNKYIDKIPYKYSFFIGSLGYTLFIGLTAIFLKIGFTILVQILILTGSLISGVIVSMFYISQFNYVNTCSQIDNEKTKYFGINMCIVQSCNIMSNLISALLIQPVGQFTYAVIMLISAFVTSLFFLFVQNYKYNTDRKQLNSQQGDSYLSQQNQDNSNLKLAKSYSDTSIKQQILDKKDKQSKKYNIPKRVVISFCFSGVIISFIYGQLSIVFFDTFQKFYQKEQLNRITFIAFIIQGIGEFLGGFCVVFAQQIITKKLGLPITYVAVTLTFLLAQVLIYYASYIESLTIMNLSCLIVGFCNCMSFTLALAIAGQWKQTGLTYFSSAQSLTVAVSLVMIAFIKFDYAIIYAGLMFILSSYGVLTYEKMIDHKKLQENFDKDINA